MKRISFILIVLACLTASYAAEQDSPLNLYLKNPNPTSYSTAVEALSNSISQNQNLNRSKLHLLYISANECNRLIDELIPLVDSLAAGERFTLANILLSMEKYDQAIGIYQILNEAYPTWSCPWRHKGEAYFRMDEMESAVMALQKAIETNPEHYDAYIWMAFALNELGEYEEALENLNKANELNPEAEDSEDQAITQEQIDELYRELRARLQ